MIYITTVWLSWGRAVCCAVSCDEWGIACAFSGLPERWVPPPLGKSEVLRGSFLYGDSWVCVYLFCTGHYCFIGGRVIPHQ
ncbi:hypothetical protein EDD17DRAFT_1611989, partial [Pisolithus thermaeus]